MLLNLQGFNSSWASDLGSFPTLWNVLEQFQTRNRLAGVTIREDLTKVTHFWISLYRIVVDPLVF